MLSTPAPFPHVGAPAFLKPDGHAVRILRRNPPADGLGETALVQFTDPARLDRKIASGNTTVALDDLAETREAAFTVNDTKPAKPAKASKPAKPAKASKPRPRRSAR